MVRTVRKPRIAWEDKFSVPTFVDLRCQCTKQLAGVLEAARERLLAFGGVRESISWQGIPWRWTVTFRRAGVTEPAFAFLIPQPGKPQLCVPLPCEILPALPPKSTSRPIRDAITFASRVGGVLWPQWEVTTKTQLEPIIELAAFKHGFKFADN
jgi:hypothetical protein